MEMRFLDTAKNFLESGAKLLPFSPFPRQATGRHTMDFPQSLRSG